jgi:O-antigen ligase
MTQVLGIFQETYLGGRSETGQEESSVARGILTQAGTAIALDNPIFGIGAERFTEVSPQYAYKVDPILIAYETDRYFSYTTLGEDEPHNDFIMMWLTHGTPALIVYILLYFIMFYNLMYSFRNSNNRFIKGVSVGLAAGLITYIVNSFYHNLLVTLPLLWIMAGFTLVTAKLAAKEKRTV